MPPPISSMRVSISVTLKKKNSGCPSLSHSRYADGLVLSLPRLLGILGSAGGPCLSGHLEQASAALREAKADGVTMQFAPQCPPIWHQFREIYRRLVAHGGQFYRDHATKGQARKLGQWR